MACAALTAATRTGAAITSAFGGIPNPPPAHSLSSLTTCKSSAFCFVPRASSSCSFSFSSSSSSSLPSPNWALSDQDSDGSVGIERAHGQLRLRLPVVHRRPETNLLRRTNLSRKLCDKLLCDKLSGQSKTLGSRRLARECRVHPLLSSASVAREEAEPQCQHLSAVQRSTIVSTSGHVRNAVAAGTGERDSRLIAGTDVFRNHSQFGIFRTRRREGGRRLRTATSALSARRHRRAIAPRHLLLRHPRGSTCDVSGRMVAWIASDWIEGASGCFADAWGTVSNRAHSDWAEGAGGCYAEIWREPFLSSAEWEKPGVVPLSASKVSKEVKPVKEICKEDLTLRSDFLVIGSGVAGLKYALGVADHATVNVVTKSKQQECNTNYAQGGISAVFDANDSVEDHIRDTIVAGANLCDEEAVEVVCREGPEQVLELMEIGAAFDRGEDGVLHLAREGGHSHHRIVHAADITGREIERALLAAANKHPNIRIFEHHFAVDFLTRQDDDVIKCYGIDAINTKTSGVVRFLSEVTMLAAGGAGHLYPCTTNPMVATGDGLAMAYRAHTVVSNMEFVQFHPTALADAGLPMPPKSRDNAFLITEAVRGAGGLLYNQDGERFMGQYDPRKELAPRDIVARSIDDQLKKRNEKYVLLDISHKPREEILSHFPNIAAECLKYGLDITKQPIPVIPAAHYVCGGVQTGLHGETSISGLYACGEVAHTGLHGANRLASNSLLEALVFSQRAISPSIKYMKDAASRGCDVWEAESEYWPRPKSWNTLKKTDSSEIAKYTASCRKRLQTIMWDYVGIVRSTERLKVAQRELAKLEHSWEARVARHIGSSGENVVSVELCESRNLFTAGKLVVESALKRQESRGLHYSLDFQDVVESERHPTMLVPSATIPLMWNSKYIGASPRRRRRSVRNLRILGVSKCGRGVK